MDGIQFSATADGSVKAERIIAGVVVDRFIARRDRPIAIKRSDSWITKAQMLLMEPSAGIVIQVPLIPPLQPTQAQQLESIKQQCEEALRHAEHFAQMIEEKAN